MQISLQSMGQISPFLFGFKERNTSNFISQPLLDKPTITPLFFFEKDGLIRIQRWAYVNSDFCLYSSIAYLVVIYYLQSYMKNRQAWDLKNSLAVWNFSLALFSAIGWVRVTQELFLILSSDNGFHKSVCVRSPINVSTIAWGILAMISKIVEFGDTIFIILRKRPLIFLHWFHHIATFIVTYNGAVQSEPILIYFGFLNLFVHAVMYTYFGLSALGVRFSRKIAMALTSTQIFQFLVGLSVTSYAVMVKLRGEQCDLSDESAKMMLAMFVTYIVLFSHFFYKNYAIGTSTKKIE